MQARILCFVIVSIAGAAVKANPTVSTKLGNVRGAVDISTGVPVEVFRGIPFAKPPVGERRFAKPEPFGRFGDLDGTNYRPNCVQSLIETHTNSSEDCLHLNVYRKEGRSYSKAELPVIILIHGGAFAFGGANQFSHSGAPLAAYTGAVVVSIQYRLGVLGFAQSDEIPANLGLRDQRLALQWVHDNIASFGGSAEKVTLMGPSAGAMSVSVHVMSPELRELNLFQAVIMDGGVMGSVVAPAGETVRRMQKITALLGYPLSGPKALKCLRDANVQDLIRLSVESPKVATTFVPSDHEDNYSPKRKGSGEFVPVRMLIGTARNEGKLFAEGRVDSSRKVSNGDDFIALCKELSDLFGVKVDTNNTDTAELLKKSYFDEHENLKTAAAEFIGDSGFVCPSNEFVEAYSRFNDDVFVYRFDRRLAQAYRNLNLDPEEGAMHWTPYVHLSGSLLTLGPFVHPSDEKFSLDSLEMISAFINGKSPSFRGVEWPAFPKTGQIFIIDETPSPKNGLHNAEKCRSLLSTNFVTKPSGRKEEL